MQKVWIVGNVLKDVYLALDERNNHFEVGDRGEAWLDVGFGGRSYGFYRRTVVFSGVATTEKILRDFGLEATVVNDWRNARSEDERCCRYMLCHGDQVAYLTSRQRARTEWEAPTEAVDWVFIDRSAELSPGVARQISLFLEMSVGTRLAVYLSRRAEAARRELAERADLVFQEGECGADDPPTNQTGFSGQICYINDRYLCYAGEKVHWHAWQIDKLTHLTTYNIIAATFLGAMLSDRAQGANIRDGANHADETSGAVSGAKTALQLAAIAAEQAHLDKFLTVDELNQILTKEQEAKVDIQAIAAAIVAAGKGILAADESGGSTHAHFAALDIIDDEPHRRDYRNLLLTTPHLCDFVNGVILFDETTRQATDDGVNFVDYLTSQGIIPGVKVDQGLADLAGTSEKYTMGLNGLSQRLYDYYQAGLRFAKWRAAFEIREGCPSERAVDENCQILAEYAKTCQDENMVPIVEPELVHAGNYSLQQCQETTGWILDHLFAALAERGVLLSACILKVNMVLAGSEWSEQSTPEEVGAATAEVLRAHVPEELAGVVFLSGGQGVEQSTDNLQAVTNQGPFPWPVTFSFARALQTPALETWRGDNSKILEAQEKFTERLKANTEALKK